MSNIFELIENNDSKGIKRLIESSIDLSQTDDRGQTPLHLAANYEDFDVIELLIVEGADLNITDDDGNTPMSLVSSFDSSILKLFLEYGADPNVKNHQGRTILDEAYESNVTDVIELLKRYGATGTIEPNDYI